MEAIQNPGRPCSTCGSTKFGILRNVQWNVVCDSMRRGNTANTEFTVVICIGCNETRFFNTPGSSHLLTLCQHETVDVAPGPSHR